jgi:hypothetical protein
MCVLFAKQPTHNKHKLPSKVVVKIIHKRPGQTEPIVSKLNWVHGRALLQLLATVLLWRSKFKTIQTCPAPTKLSLEAYERSEIGHYPWTQDSGETGQELTW